ncbi:carbohydrate porin [Cognatiluteimonas telluris]|uniref:carbohydrate porin n=1 Tax=Cognatiluteimonas telluris TaxID=1104775 RepID=UPI00140C0499|nr:carbohydrate porin [Lysobacter telluris]
MKRTVLGLCLLSALASPVYAAGAPARTEAQRIAALEAQVQALQTELESMKAGAVTVVQAPAAGSEEAAASAVAATAPAGDTSGSETTGSDSTAAELDALAASPQDAAASDTAQVAAPSAGGGDSNANAFNPAISVILNGSYSHHSLDPAGYQRTGFPLAGEGAPSAKGISLGESELSLASNIDDKFFGQLTFTAESEDGADHVGVEEAFIETTSLPDNLSVRAGRFYSNIGYLNSHHAHTDNFFDRPLPYQAFLGNQYGDDGVQLRWVAPTSMFLELGGEMFRGANYPSGGAQDGGIGARTLFAHVGGDVGTNNSWLAGVSMLRTQAAGAEDGFTGDTTLYIADGTWKWAPNGNTKDGGMTLRGEYFVDNRDGAFADPTDPSVSTLWNGQRRGAYLESVYRLNRSWDIGYRYDRLWSDDGNPFVAGNDGFDPYRHSAEITWRNSEFSLVRLQLSHDKPNPVDSDNAVTLQYQTAIGAHGAHKF